MDDVLMFSAETFYMPTQPVIDAVWRGSFHISSKKIRLALRAHLSNKACLKAFEAAQGMPELLPIEILSRLKVWPESFSTFPPTDKNIALYFFWQDGRDEPALDNLIHYVNYKDFALKALVGDAELLVFTSHHLPEKHQRIQGKFYLWGVFSGNQMQVAQQSATKQSAVSKRGRPKDTAWEHAAPYDGKQTAAKCKYCHLVSKNGGISRLKAHLGGGDPGWSIKGCQKVPMEVKNLMASWSNQRVKKDNAFSSATVKRGRPTDSAWEHALPYEGTKYGTKCKYCHLVSTFGGITRLKAHLGGGDAGWSIGGCPNVPPEIESEMAPWSNKRVKMANAPGMKESGEELQVGQASSSGTSHLVISNMNVRTASAETSSTTSDASVGLASNSRMHHHMLFDEGARLSRLAPDSSPAPATKCTRACSSIHKTLNLESASPLKSESIACFDDGSRPPLVRSTRSSFPSPSSSKVLTSLNELFTSPDLFHPPRSGNAVNIDAALNLLTKSLDELPPSLEVTRVLQEAIHASSPSDARNILEVALATYPNVHNSYLTAKKSYIQCQAVKRKMAEHCRFLQLKKNMYHQSKAHIDEYERLLKKKTELDTELADVNAKLHAVRCIVDKLDMETLLKDTEREMTEMQLLNMDYPSVDLQMKQYKDEMDDSELKWARNYRYLKAALSLRY